MDSQALKNLSFREQWERFAVLGFRGNPHRTAESSQKPM